MLVSQIFVAPGNGGTVQGLEKVANVSIAVDDFPELIDFAKKLEINFVVPGQLFYEHSFTILPCFLKTRSSVSGAVTVLS